MQKDLKYTTDKDILNYIMVKTIGGYNEKSLIVKMEDLWVKIHTFRIQKVFLINHSYFIQEINLIF